MDIGNCMFYDATKPTISFNVPVSGHRKIVGYYNVSGSDLSDYVGGHGKN